MSRLPTTRQPNQSPSQNIYYNILYTYFECLRLCCEGRSERQLIIDHIIKSPRCEGGAGLEPLFGTVIESGFPLHMYARSVRTRAANRRNLINL